MLRSSSWGVPAGRTTSNRAASRGSTGRSAMRSGGNSKSNRSERIVRCQSSVLSNRRITDHRSLTPDFSFDDLVGIDHRLAALDLVDILHAFGHSAPDRVLTIEERRVGKANEELAVAGVRVGGARHRDRAAHMLFLVE